MTSDFIFLIKMDKVKSCFEFVKNNKPGSDFGKLRCSPNTLYQGETLAMFIFRNWKIDCPEWAKHDPEIVNKFGKVAFMVWCSEVRTEPPEWTRVDPLVQVSSGFSDLPQRNASSNPYQYNHRHPDTEDTSNFDSIPLMFWIQYTTLPIKDYLMTTNINLTRDKRGETPMMYWIKYRNDDVPNELLHDHIGLRNSSKETPAMLWIKYRGELPPKNLLHNPYATNSNDDTLAEYWIKYAKDNKNIPEEIQYKRKFQSLTTIERHWYQISDDDAPSWMSGRTISVSLPDFKPSVNLETSQHDVGTVMSEAMSTMPKVNKLISDMSNLKNDLLSCIDNVRQLEIAQLTSNTDNNDEISELSLKILNIINTMKGLVK